MSSSAPLAPEILLECVNCHARNKVASLYSERSSDLEPGLIEGISTCPECGHVTHVYWLPRELAVQRRQIFETIKVLSRRRTPINFQRAKKLKEKYKNLYDREQLRVQEIADGRTA